MCVCVWVAMGVEYGVISMGVCCWVLGMSRQPPHHISPCVKGNGLIDHFLVSPLGMGDNQ